MQPGRELDALVAEKVMGCVVNRERSQPECGCEEVKGIKWIHRMYPHGFDYSHPDPYRTNYCCQDPCLLAYSTDIAAAWEVVEKVWPRESHFYVYKGMGSDNRWECNFMVTQAPDKLGDERRFSYGETAAHAICLAALKAVGYKEKAPDPRTEGFTSDSD